MKKSVKIILLSLVLLTFGTGSALAAIWSSTNMQLLYGSGYELASSEDATIITIEHASGWKYGDNFFFFDIWQPFDKDTNIYGEWHPRFSLGKMTGSDMSFGFVKDVLIATELNVERFTYGAGWRAYLYGVGFDLNIPHFDFFAINFFIRDDMTIADDRTFQISPSWNIPFTLGELRFEFGGFLDYSGAEGDGEAQLLTAPQLLLDVSNFKGSPRNFYIGMEYQYWKNKYGVDGADESVAQLMAKWVF
jgi:nucleoside-specific outer membrane channel protein Tsx